LRLFRNDARLFPLWLRFPLTLESLHDHYKVMSVLTNITDTAGRLLLHALKQVIVPAVGACIVAYFVYYAVHGDRGILAKHQIEGQIAEAKRMLAEVKDERTRLEIRADRLRTDRLDVDLLEERAREMLNFAHPRDVVVPLPKLYVPEQPAQ
jgi:cell division protein FtsB